MYTRQYDTIGIIYIRTYRDDISYKKYGNTIVLLKIVIIKSYNISNKFKFILTICLESRD